MMACKPQKEVYRRRYVLMGWAGPGFSLRSGKVGVSWLPPC